MIISKGLLRVVLLCSKNHVIHTTNALVCQADDCSLMDADSPLEDLRSRHPTFRDSSQRFPNTCTFQRVVVCTPGQQCGLGLRLPKQEYTRINHYKTDDVTH